EVEIEQGCELKGDRDLLMQLFANLIENALTHVPAPSTISVALKRSGKELRCIVADEGPGIPEQEHDKVFRRLYRLERSRTTPGSGLGLSMVAAIADLHGARVRLENNRPGLIVSVTFEGLERSFGSSLSPMTLGRHGAQLPIG